MIKEMQGRFVQIAMLFFTAVLLCLLLGLNGFNYWQTVQDLDDEASHLSREIGRASCRERV